MKRVLVGMLIVCLALVGEWFLWSSARRHRAEPAARLVPAETLLLVECPDLSGSAMRWRETALAGIFREPEVAAFLAKPLGQLRQSETWKRILTPLLQIQPRSGFLAVASMTQNMPHAVAGCYFAGDPKQAEKLIAEARAQAQAASPNGKLNREAYGAYQIESFSDNGVTVAACMAGKALFIANDIDLLKSTLERASGKLPVALSTSLAYRKSMKRLPQTPDLRLFVQPNPYSDKLLAQLVLPASPKEGGIEAFALGVRFEGERLRERLFILQKPTGPHPQLSQKTMGLTTPDTLFYGAMAPLFSEETSDRPGPPPASGHPMRILLSALNTAAPPATFTQFKNAFGPEHALLLEWPENRAEPSLFFALEVRDAGSARNFVENAFRAWTKADAGGISFWIHNGNAPVHPAVALTERHFLVGLSPESLAPFASGALNAPVDEGPLAKSAPYIGAMAAVSKPQIGMAYLDARPFFERFYGWLRPMIILWGSVKMGDSWDFGKLPAPSTISKHLAPVSLSATQTGSGVLLESTGPVTFLEVSVGLGALASAVLNPTFQIGPPNPQARPPLRSSPLSAPDTTPEPSPSPDASSP